MKSAYRIIVVDDDPANNLICKHIIHRFDKEAQVTLFTDPAKALEAIKEIYSLGTDSNPTIILLDINMPVITGWEFLEKFKMLDEKIRKQITIYILSSSIDDGDIEKADKNPYVKAYFQKPLRLETVRLILQLPSDHPTDKKLP
ncbi:response regulator [Dyadobacter sp. NIV53]|uniref:response regulator n=1 Tax=Dyadobacter sp. NIV53 TaxID=2861765 RepID=UPI001C88C699|nr:response regulator [Dyadobacter sp. NIV53]